MIIPKNVQERFDKVLLKEAIKYCESVNATEIYNVAYIGDGDYRIMYYTGTSETKNRKMSVVLLRVPHQTKI